GAFGEVCLQDGYIQQCTQTDEDIHEILQAVCAVD
ncbi:MAG: hypothetical protein UW80_C0052G0009, partial [Microgenomates group bacterium GW2011_GWC1_44_9]